MILVNKIAQVEDCSPVCAVFYFRQQTRKVTFLEDHIISAMLPAFVTTDDEPIETYL